MDDLTEPRPRAAGALLCVAALAAALAGGAAAPPHAVAQPRVPTDRAVASSLERAREQADELNRRLEVLRERVERKRAYLEKIERRLETAANDDDPERRAHRVSRYAYQSFLVASRAAAEELKLRETEELLALAPRLRGPGAESAMRDHLREAARARVAAADRLLRRADRFRPLITAPAFSAQFEAMVGRIRAERQALEDFR